MKAIHVKTYQRKPITEMYFVLPTDTKDDIESRKILQMYGHKHIN